MDDYFASFIAIMAFTASIFFFFSAFTWEEVDGTVRDKYVSHSTQYLLVDYSTGETKTWDVRPEYYETCEIGDKIHRNADGSLTCE